LSGAGDSAPFIPGQREVAENTGAFPLLTKLKKRAEKEAAQIREFRDNGTDFRTLVEAIPSAIFINQGERIRYVNHSAEVITGYSREELLSMDFWDMLHSESREPLLSRARVWQEEIGVSWRCEVRILTKNRQERWLDVTAARIDFHGIKGGLFSAFDLTERKRAEEQANVLAVTDPLTGLGNYRKLLEALDVEVMRSGRTGRPFAMLLLDLDGLKKINDRFGHLLGSRALCRLGDVLRANCRAIDTAARYGGDEFAIILPETSAVAAQFLAHRIHRGLARDLELPPLSASIGVASYPNDADTIEGLLRTADQELYGVKGWRAAHASSPVSVAS
jgi:diguanylate cyclase (GGDEF)-like protein/PAS domain S-box-containing protein